MNSKLDAFEKRHDFLICVDSDGCAIDNLTAKHQLCFGPCLIREWGLEKYQKEILALWERINLYGLTRGIHRFRALALALTEINERLTPIQGLSEYTAWIDSTEFFSSASLEEQIRKTPSAILEKALHWSKQVNQAVAALPWTKKQFFEGVDESLSAVADMADIAVVSSANQDAVTAEWQHGGLSRHADIFLCQEAGSKARCIAKLKEKGYHESRMLMVGDAPGDRASAEVNGIAFYPILAGREKESWQAFPKAVRQFCKGDYQPLERRLSEEFMMNLAGGKNND
jgi:phosphoglycolate phosphatase-like HAD superfamily hydrolase